MKPLLSHVIPPERAPAAPPWHIQAWFNADAEWSLASLGGSVIMLHAFQMLCPACVSHAVDQSKRVAALFDHPDFKLIGLHTVFEHHEAMTPTSLAAFLHEYRITYPIAVDQPGPDSPVPRTMAAYDMRGTPTTILIDRQGRLRYHRFGMVDDLVLGAATTQLLLEP